MPMQTFTKQNTAAEIVLFHNHIEQFIDFLNKNNFNISFSEKVDIYKAVEFIDISNKNEFYFMLFSLVVKDEGKILIFNSLFDIFFNNINFNTEQSQIATSTPLEGIVSNYKFEKYNYGSLLKYIVLNEKDKIKRLLHLSANNIDFSKLKNTLQIGEISNKIKKNTGISEISKMLEDFKNYLINSKASTDDVERIVQNVENELKNIKKNIREFVKNKINESNNLNNNNIENKSLLNITNFEYEEIKKLVPKLILKLKLKKSIKLKEKRKGVLNLKKTLKNSVKYNLIPFKIYFKKKVPNKTELVILCDISESVRNFSKLFLQFAYGISESFKKVKSYLFISECGDVTDIFKTNDVENGVEIAINQVKIDRNTHSNYSFAFENFINKFEQNLTSKTIIIIIGDGRSNFSQPAIEQLIYIKKRVKKMIWLNPEPVNIWGMGDSDMEYYKKIADLSYSVSSLNQLEKFVENLNFKI